MGKIDKEKEYIGALKAYLGFIMSTAADIAIVIVAIAFMSSLIYGALQLTSHKS